VKTLLLMRHGKSDWNAPFDHDHDRPLAKRGVNAARLMGRLLARAREVPDSVITSSAVRAENTVRLAASEGRWECPIRSTDRLYNSRVETVLDEVYAEPDATVRLMIVGHEPTWSSMLAVVVGGGRYPFPTAAVARLDLPADTWDGVQMGTGELRWLVTPRLMADVVPPDDA
jgi:phosphohistidine phosphatase